MELMGRYPDKYFDLAIVDPPYGIGEHGGKCRTRKSKKTNGIKKEWDSIRPNFKYFIELIRVSKNQIVWGGNYFSDILPVSRCWIYWQKNMGGDFSDGELAWTSFDKVLKQYNKRSETFNRIHPTQKPVALYKWILDKYAKPNNKILDTHLGSGSIAIACHDYGFDLTACELDKEYFDNAMKRIRNHQKQIKLF
jgi:site-specific DNA-methyltransferase (adenine-specific)